MSERLTTRGAARKWALSEKATDERPHLSKMVLRLCREHEQMQHSLYRLALKSESVTEAAVGLEGIEDGDRR